MAKDLQRCNGRWSPIHASNVEYRVRFGSLRENVGQSIFPRTFHRAHAFPPWCKARLCSKAGLPVQRCLPVWATQPADDSPPLALPPPATGSAPQVQGPRGLRHPGLCAQQRAGGQAGGHKHAHAGQRVGAAELAPHRQAGHAAHRRGRCGGCPVRRRSLPRCGVKVLGDCRHAAARHGCCSRAWLLLASGFDEHSGHLRAQQAARSCHAPPLPPLRPPLQERPTSR